MSNYLRPILRFGLITPGLLNGVLLGAAGMGIYKLAETRKVKNQVYQQEMLRQSAVKSLESKIALQRKDFADKKLILHSDSSQIFTRSLDSLLAKYKPVELERMGMVFLLDKGKVNRPVLSEATRVKSGFEGGIGPMQEALLQVESLMPQAVLEEMKITRKADLVTERRERLAFDITHVCWRAGEAKR